MWIVVAAAIGGCATAPTSTSPRADRPIPPVSAVVEAADAPAGWSLAAAQRCGELPSDPRGACYEEVLMELLARHGVRSAMQTLELLPNRSGEMSHHGHMLAHHVGIAAYRGADRIGEVFAECTPAFQSGCYHGVVQAYFADPAVTRSPGGVDAASLNALCAEHRGPGGDQWLLFQCLHGMGHGLVALHDDHLPRALRSCDLLHDEWEREGCYGGAFMENVVGATIPHHAPRADSEGHAGHAHHDHGAPPTGEEPAHDHHAHARTGGHQHHAAAAGERQEHDAHHHHDHGDEGVDEAFVPLDPANPHHPCSALDQRYEHACYSMQTSAVLFWADGDVGAGIELCETAPERVRRTCYASLGRDINAWVDGDHGAAIARCGQVPEAFRPDCAVGVAKNLIDVTADPSDGIAFCNALPAGRSRDGCFRAVGQQLLLLEPSDSRREEICLALETPDARHCLPGAGLPPELAGRAGPD
jgi:hypothetical protein